MKNDTLFGNCVVNCSLQDLLTKYKNEKILISGVYADLTGSFDKEKSVITQITDCNLSQNCVVGFTVAARGTNDGANFTNEYSHKLLNLMSKTFIKNLIEDESGVFVYGEKQRMATCIFKSKKL